VIVTDEQGSSRCLVCLVNLRTRINELQDMGGTAIDAPKIDQSAFACLDLSDAGVSRFRSAVRAPGQRDDSRERIDPDCEFVATALRSEALDLS